PRQGGTGLDGRAQEALGAGTLAAGHEAGGERAPTRLASAVEPSMLDKIGDDRLVGGDVVEVAEAILQPLERGLERARALFGLPAWEQGREEVARIAQFFRPNAHLVALAGVELFELLGLLDELAAAARELVRRKVFNRRRHPMRLAHPIADLEPGNDVEQ